MSNTSPENNDVSKNTQERPIVIPQTSSEKKFLRPPKRDPSEIINHLEEKNVVDYAPNALSEQEAVSLLTELRTAIDQETDLRRFARLTELHTYIERNRVLFPEFSHGTSSDALGNIARAGIYPRQFAVGIYMYEETTQTLGEGTKGGRVVDKEDRTGLMSAGAGEGGLGTAMAYADMVENPDWNPNNLETEELKVQIAVMESDLTGIEIDTFSNRLARLKTALKRRELGIPVDYPVVIGFDGSRKFADPTQLPSENWITSDQFVNGKVVRSVARDSNKLDSEVMFNDLDQVMPLAINTVSCPENEIEETRKKLDGEGRTDIQIISMEALRELRNFGHNRITKAEEATKHRVVDNLNLEKLSEIIERRSLKRKNSV